MKCSGKNCPVARPYDVGGRTLTEVCGYVTPLPSNADKIRAMSDKELAEFLEDWDFCYGYCPQGITNSPYNPDCSHNCEEQLLSWLRQPAEEET